VKTSIFIDVVFAGLLVAGCSTTTYLSLTENNKEQIEDKLKYDERDEDVGVEIILSQQNGTEIRGELLSVRDSTIIICSIYGASEVQLARIIYPIYNVRNDEIQEITIEGSNYVWAGLGIGIAGGTLTGILVGLAIGTSRGSYIPAEVGLGVLGFIAGAIAGPIVGYALSTEEFVLQEIPPGYDFSLLKPLARYPDEEPEYLRAIK